MDLPIPTPLPASDAATGADRASEYRTWFAALRRRRWLVLTAGIVSGFGAWWVQRLSPLEYTAEVLLQQSREATQLVAIGLESSQGMPSDFESQAEKITSYAVLGPVVDSLGLQLRLRNDRSERTERIASVEVSEDAERGDYVLMTRSDQVVLSGEEGEIARANPGEWVEGPGFRILLASSEPLREPVTVYVVARRNAVERLAREIEIEPGTSTTSLRVSYTHPDPVWAAKVANQVAQAYVDYRTAAARETVRRRREFIAGQLVLLADSVREAQEHVLRYQQDPQLPEGGDQATQARLSAAQEETRELRLQEGLLSSLVKGFADGTGETGLHRVVALGNETLPGGADLYRRLQDLEIQRSRLTASRYGYTDAGPEVEVVDSLIAVTRTQMRQLAEETLGLVRKRLQEADTYASGLRGQLATVPGRNAELARLQQRVSAAQDVFDALAEKYYETQIEEGLEAGDIEIMVPAAVPLRPDSSGIPGGNIIAVVFGLMMGVGLVFVVDHLDPSVLEADDAVRAAGLPVLGTIPHLPEGQPNSLRRRAGIEAFRALRTNLRPARTIGNRVMGVTSAASGEGKSLIASNLALAFAHQGARVLLVDADVRRPTLARLFRVDRTPGLLDVLVGRSSVSEAVREVPDCALYLLPCGTTDLDAPELLSGPALPSLLAVLRSQFDIVIIDTPPVLAVTDASLLGSAVDEMIVVVRAQRTERLALGQTVAQLRKVEARLTGLVLNDAPDWLKSRDEYYSYTPSGEAEDTKRPSKVRALFSAGARN